MRNVKVGANVPVFVLEFLLGKYCASSDPVAIEMGLQVVNDTLAENYIRPDESMKAQSKVMDQGRHSFIDKVKVRVADGERWAEAVNFGDRYLHIPPEYPRDYERLLTGGVWAQIDVKLRVRRRVEGQALVLDHPARPDPDRHLRPRRVPVGADARSPPMSGSTS